MTITLHHNAMSTCSQKVRLALEEKGVTWTSSEINLIAREHKADSYLAMNPGGVVPTLEVDGIAIIESSIINEYVNDSFDGPALLPEQGIERARARHWVKRVDDRVHAASGVVTYATVMRMVMMSMPREVVLADIAKTVDPHARDVRTRLFTDGVEAPEFQTALDDVLGYVASIEKALTSSIWLSGAGFCLADCCAFPYVLRIEHLGLSAVWSDGRMPQVERWMAAIKGRPSFDAAIGRWVQDHALGMFAMAGTQIAPKVKPQ